MGATTLTPTETVRVDADRLARELHRRGMTARQFCKVAHIPEVSFSLARHGRRIRPQTLRKIVDTLVKIPVLEGVDAILPEAPANSHQSLETKRSQRSTDAAPRGGHVRARQSQA